MMRDLVLVEAVGTHVRFRRGEAQLPARHEPQQIALGPTVRAVAFVHPLELAFHLESDPPAMASALIDHCPAPRTGTARLSRLAGCRQATALSADRDAARPCQA